MTQGSAASKSARNVRPKDHQKGMEYAAGLAKTGWTDEALLKQSGRFAAKGKTDFAEGMSHFVLAAKAKAAEPVVFGGPAIGPMSGFELAHPTEVTYQCIGPKEARHIADVVLSDGAKGQLPELEDRLAALIVELANSEQDYEATDISGAIDSEIEELTRRMSKPPLLVMDGLDMVERMSTVPTYGENYPPSLRSGRVLMQSVDGADIYRFLCHGVQATRPSSSDPRDIINWIFLRNHAKPEAEAFIEYMQKEKAPDNYGTWGKTETDIGEVIEEFWKDRWQPDVVEVAKDMIDNGVFIPGFTEQATRFTEQATRFAHLLLPEADPTAPVLVPRTPASLANFYDRKALDWLSGRQTWKGPDTWDKEQEIDGDLLVRQYRTRATQLLLPPPHAQDRVFITDENAFDRIKAFEGDAWAKHERQNAGEPNTFFDAKEGFKILIDEGLVGQTMKDPDTGKMRPIMIGDITGSAGFIGAQGEIYIITSNGEIVVLADTLVPGVPFKRVRWVGEPKASVRKSSRRSAPKKSPKSPKKSSRKVKSRAPKSEVKPELPNWTVGVRPEGDHTSEKFEQMVTDIANAAHHVLMTVPYIRAYLYFRPSTEEQWGELLVSGEDTPLGAQVAVQGAIPGNMTKEQLRAWVRQFAMRLPLLPRRDPPARRGSIV